MNISEPRIIDLKIRLDDKWAYIPYYDWPPELKFEHYCKKEGFNWCDRDYKCKKCGEKVPNKYITLDNLLNLEI